jgi:hypothetical protein
MVYKMEHTYEVTYLDHGQTTEGLAVVVAESRWDAGQCVMAQADLLGTRRKLTDISLVSA